MYLESFIILWVKNLQQGTWSRCRGYDSDGKGYLTPAEAEKFLDSVRAATDLGGRWARLRQ